MSNWVNSSFKLFITKDVSKTFGICHLFSLFKYTVYQKILIFTEFIILLSESFTNFIILNKYPSKFYHYYYNFYHDFEMFRISGKYVY